MLMRPHGVPANWQGRVKSQQYCIELLKKWEAPATAVAHNPPPPELPDACARLGILVMDGHRFLDSSAERLADLERIGSSPSAFAGLVVSSGVDTVSFRVLYYPTAASPVLAGKWCLQVKS